MIFIYGTIVLFLVCGILVVWGQAKREQEAKLDIDLARLKAEIREICRMPYAGPMTEEELRLSEIEALEPLQMELPLNAEPGDVFWARSWPENIGRRWKLTLREGEEVCLNGDVARKYIKSCNKHSGVRLICYAAGQWVNDVIVDNISCR